jgi:hypothetical protein
VKKTKELEDEMARLEEVRQNNTSEIYNYNFDRQNNTSEIYNYNFD